MKKVITTIVITVLVIALLEGGYFAYRFIHSPEYALMQTVSDVQESGLDGLRPHLTTQADDKIEKITSLADNSLISFAYDALGLDDYVSILKSEMQNVEWSTGEFLKGSERAEVQVAFTYEDKFSGTLSLELLLEDEEWKINDISDVTIDEMSL